jgi:hypothetical protein
VDLNNVDAVAEQIGIPLAAWAGNCHGVSVAIVRSGVLRSLGGPDTKYRVARGHYRGPVSESSYFYAARGGRAYSWYPHSWIQSHGLTVPCRIDPPLRINREIDPLASVLASTMHDPIIDPTRHAFTGEPAALYVVPRGDEYDEGGNVLREGMIGPAPQFDPSHKAVNLQLPAVTEHWISFIDPTRHAFTDEPAALYVVPRGDEYDEGGNVLREGMIGPAPQFDPSHKAVSLQLPAVTEHWISLQLAGKGYPYGYYTYQLCMWLGNLSPQLLGEHARPIYTALARAGHVAIIPFDNRLMVLGE